MRKKNLHLKPASTFFGQKEGMNHMPHKISQRVWMNDQVKLFTNSHASAQPIAFKPPQINRKESDRTFAKAISIFRSQYQKQVKLRKNSKRSSKWASFASDKENIQLVNCNAGFRNPKRYGRNFIKPAQQKSISCRKKQLSLSVEGTKCVIPRNQTMASCGMSLHRPSGDKIQSFERSVRNSCNQTLYSVQPPPQLNRLLVHDFEQINFVINSIKVSKESFGREIYTNIKEQKQDRVSLASKPERVTTKIDKHERMRPSTSQPSLRNKFFLTSK